MDKRLAQLNEGNAQDRLFQLRNLIESEEKAPEILEQFANNHIHTKYSFSPYSPTAAVYYARLAGLPTAGIIDHDSIAGAKEFIEAGKIAGVATTVGIECRVSVAGTSLEGRRINNPDQLSVAYMALHGVPHHKIDYVNDFFAPYRDKRNIRNREMVKKINTVFSQYGIELDFDKDVVSESWYIDGGTVTERHILYALAVKIAGLTDNASGFLINNLGLNLNEKQIAQMNERNSEYFLYDLLGILKGAFVKKIYIDATDELIHISQLKQLAADTGALMCYAYLGDVTNSVTGDKLQQKFEDDYIDILFDELKKQGVDAVTYMPSRNTHEQLSRIIEMCNNYGFIQISGEDINSLRQSFICSQLAEPEFSHLTKATWSLIKRENELSQQG